MKKRNQLTFLSCNTVRGVRDDLYTKVIKEKLTWVFIVLDTDLIKMDRQITYQMIRTVGLKEKLCLG